jgi:hypothetical protein
LAAKFGQLGGDWYRWLKKPCLTRLLSKGTVSLDVFQQGETINVNHQ